MPKLHITAVVVEAKSRHRTNLWSNYLLSSAVMTVVYTKYTGCGLHGVGHSPMILSLLLYALVCRKIPLVKHVFNMRRIWWRDRINSSI